MDMMDVKWRPHKRPKNCPRTREEQLRVHNWTKILQIAPFTARSFVCVDGSYFQAIVGKPCDGHHCAIHTWALGLYQVRETAHHVPSVG